MRNNNRLALIPVMFCFFAMGFVDLVGTASNYVKQDLALSDTVANFLPSLVFFWFLIFSVPTGVLMNKIGRKKTVMLSLIVTVISLLLPIFSEDFAVMLISFSLLGIGNALMQTSLNPLVSSLVKGHLASTLTFGQFIKAIASFMAPIIASWGAAATIPSLGLGWRVLFPIYMVIGILASLLLQATPIQEKETDMETVEEQKSVGRDYIDTFKLLGNPYVLLCFFGIMCHVGIDVGSNTTAPKLLQQYAGMALNDAAWATSLYFIFRTIGCMTGSFFLRVLKTRTFFIISVTMMALSMACMLMGAYSTTETSKWWLYTGIALVGYGNSNVFSMCFSQALLYMPEKKNGISGLMIMGLFGGTIFPLIMGIASDAVNSQVGAVVVMAVGVIYLLTFIKQIKY
ncbi:MFS transporter [Hallella multisaccharivorax DSM 17128]|uniref:Major facilitator superfamily MFS_1 n=1 Tax=Hallella multisaccharivorax DSM 17128 TaxID=688246 RepID=F8NCG1_9BACT|nr:MFS transporter [Hallella multisaccharivorax]EGN56051.1 major facilitator superfamily MFS_1 [Hallella multisaccharivorax DSM 17128]GJG29547.1 MFS transporter [Hallella multisaccharivorax DSM 17128]